MRRAIVMLVIVSFHFVGCCIRLSYGADPSAAASGQKTSNSASDQHDAPTRNLVEDLAKPFAQAVKSFAQRNPDVMDQIAKRSKITPLHSAASGNKTTEAERLLAAGADPNARDFQGSTPLHYAAHDFGADVKKAFSAMFVGQDLDMEVVNALYEATHNYVAFRAELTKAYGPDASGKFDALKMNGTEWTITLPVVAEESQLERMGVSVQGDQAVCRQFPQWEKADVRFVLCDGVWRIDAGFLVPILQPQGILRSLSTVSRTLQKGHEIIRQSGSWLEDVKRAMWEEFKGSH